MTSTTLFSDVVLPAATWYEKHDLSSTDMHPFVHAFNPAIPRPGRPAPTSMPSTPWPSRSRGWRRRISASGGTWSRCRCSTTRRTRWPCRTASSGTGGPTGGRPYRDRLPQAGRRRARLPECRREDGRARPADRLARPDHQGRHLRPGTSVEYLKGKNGVVRGGVADGRPRLDRDVQACEAILAMSGTTNGQLAVEGFQALERRTGTKLADLAAEHEGKQITFADTQARPTPVITSPEWSGSESGGRRYSPFVINVERSKPWHTLTGRQHFFLDHDWMAELGEQLPVFRPPLDMHALFGEPRIGAYRRARGERALPDPALEVVDPLGVPGQPVHAVAVARRPDDLDVAAGRGEDRGRRQRLDRGGQPQRRHRRPGDRLAPDARRAPCTCTTRRSGSSTCRSPRPAASAAASTTRGTRLLIKPTHLIGGYAQLSYAFNYLGPTGNQRDEVTDDPPPQPGGDVLMPEAERPMRHGPDGDGDEPRQVHRLPHLLGDVQAGVDQPLRRRVRLVQQRRDPARPGLSAHLRGPGQVEGRLDAEQTRPAHAPGRRSVPQAADDLHQPAAAQHQRLLRAVDLRLREPDHRTGAAAHPGGAAEVAADRQGHEGRVVGQLGRRPRRRAGS